MNRARIRDTGNFSAHAIVTAGLVAALVPLAAARGTATALPAMSASVQQDAPPVVTILGPRDQAIVRASNELTIFGMAEDPQDGSSTHPTLTMAWSSNLDGPLGVGFVLRLPGGSLRVGTHVVTASATGSTGLTGTASVTVSVIASGNTSPQVFFYGPDFGGTADGASFVAGQQVVLYGGVSDLEDGFNQSPLTWSSDRDGLLGTGVFVAPTTLSVGTHAITASTTDAGGLATSNSLRVIVSATPLPLPSVDSIRLLEDSIPLGERWEWSFTTTHAQTVTIRVNQDGFTPGPASHQSWVDGVQSINSIADGATIIVTATNSTGSSTAQIRAHAIRPAHLVLTASRTLTANHVGTIEIAADDVTLDGNGFTISHGTGQLAYVRVNRARRATIRNLVIQGAGGSMGGPQEAGIILATSTDSVIEDVTIRAVRTGVAFVTNIPTDPPNTGHRLSRIAVDDAVIGIADSLRALGFTTGGPTSGIVIEQSTITDVETAIELGRASTGNTLSDNTITDASAFGHGSPCCLGIETVTSGVRIVSGDGNSIVRNTVSGVLGRRSSFGIDVRGPRNRIVANTVTGFITTGVRASGDAVEITDNIATGTVANPDGSPPRGIGFDLAGTNATILRNRADDNSDVGFRFANLSGSLVQANRACRNGVWDAVIEASALVNAFVDNTFCVLGPLPSISAVGPARLWLGVGQAADVGTRFDLRAETYFNGALIATGQLVDVRVDGLGFGAAALREIALPPIDSLPVGPGDVLSLWLSVRISTKSTHASGTATIWYDDAAATSRVEVTRAGTPIDYFLRSSLALEPFPGAGPRKTADVLADRRKGNPWRVLGEWRLGL